MNSRRDEQKTDHLAKELSQSDTSSRGSSCSDFHSSKPLLSPSVSDRQGQQATVSDKEQVSSGNGKRSPSGFLKVSCPFADLENPVGADFDIKALLEKSDILPNTLVEGSVSSEVSGMIAKGGDSDSRGTPYKSAMKTLNEPSLGHATGGSRLPISCSHSAAEGHSSPRNPRAKRRSACEPESQQVRSSSANEQPKSSLSQRKQMPALTPIPKFSGSSPSKIPRILSSCGMASNAESSKPSPAHGHRSVATRSKTFYSKKLNFNQKTRKPSPEDSPPSEPSVLPSLDGRKVDKRAVLDAENSQKSSTGQSLSENPSSTLPLSSVPDQIICLKDDVSLTSPAHLIPKVISGSTDNLAQEHREPPAVSESDSPSTPINLIRQHIFETTKSRRASRKQTPESLIRSRRKLPFEISDEMRLSSPDLKRNIGKPQNKARASSMSVLGDSSDTEASQTLEIVGSLELDNIVTGQHEEIRICDNIVDELPVSKSDIDKSSSRKYDVLEGKERSEYTGKSSSKTYVLEGRVLSGDGTLDGSPKSSTGTSLSETFEFLGQKHPGAGDIQVPSKSATSKDCPKPLDVLKGGEQPGVDAQEISPTSSSSAGTFEFVGGKQQSVSPSLEVSFKSDTPTTSSDTFEFVCGKQSVSPILEVSLKSDTATSSSDTSEFVCGKQSATPTLEVSLKSDTATSSSDTFEFVCGKQSVSPILEVSLKSDTATSSSDTSEFVWGKQSVSPILEVSFESDTATSSSDTFEFVGGKQSAAGAPEVSAKSGTGRHTSSPKASEFLGGISRSDTLVISPISDTDRSSPEGFEFVGGKQSEAATVNVYPESEAGTSPSKTFEVPEEEQSEAGVGSLDDTQYKEATLPQRRAPSIKRAPHSSKSSASGSSKQDSVCKVLPVSSNKPKVGDLARKILKLRRDGIQKNDGKTSQSNRESRLSSAKKCEGAIPATSHSAVKVESSNLKPKKQANESEVKKVPASNSRLLDTKSNKVSSSTKVTRTEASSKPRSSQVTKSLTGLKGKAVQLKQNKDATVINVKSIGVQTEPVLNLPPTVQNVEPQGTLSTRSLGIQASIRSPSRKASDRITPPITVRNQSKKGKPGVMRQTSRSNPSGSVQ